jgi:cellulose synthase/poly-beta-1,6-N-acetylglucosamine synthase-like glycosyltransferase
MSHFAGMTEAINDALGHADCLGSGYIMRRTALASIGGFPTESLSEAFIPEAVQYGSVPDSYLGHVKQRTRWVSNASGNLFVCVDLVYGIVKSHW